MGRTLTPTFQAQMEARGRDSAEVLEITLPLKSGEPSPVQIYVAPRELSIGAQSYLPALRALGDVSFSEGFSVDGVSGAIENASGVWGSVLSESDRTLDGAGVVVRKAVKNASGAWEADDCLPGVLTGVRITGREVSFQIVSDLSTAGCVVANDPVGELPKMGAVAAQVSGADARQGDSGYPDDSLVSGLDRRFFGGGRFLPL